MQILIKIVQGTGFMVDVDGTTTVLELKKKIQEQTLHSIEQQTLVLVGKTLLDEKPLSFYPNIKDGTKINLLIKKVTKDTLNVVLTKFLQKYYTESQSTKISDKFMKDFEQKISSLSLDDLERMATAYLNEESG